VHVGYFFWPQCMSVIFSGQNASRKFFLARYAWRTASLCVFAPFACPTLHGPRAPRGRSEKHYAPYGVCHPDRRHKGHCLEFAFWPQCMSDIFSGPNACPLFFLAKMHPENVFWRVAPGVRLRSAFLCRSRAEPFTDREKMGDGPAWPMGAAEWRVLRFLHSCHVTSVMHHAPARRRPQLTQRSRRRPQRPPLWLPSSAPGTPRGRSHPHFATVRVPEAG